MYGVVVSRRPGEFVFRPDRECSLAVHSEAQVHSSEHRTSRRAVLAAG